jgi:glycosyltransferase involved in cell wall biosynthesis
MHIAYLTTEYPIEDAGAYGGIATSIKNLALGLTQNGHQATVFMINSQQDKIVDDNGVQIVFIKSRKFPALQWYFNKKHIQNVINRKITSENIDVIESPDWTGLSSFMRFKCPSVIRFNGTDAYFCYLEGRKQKPKNYWLEKLALKNTDYLVSVSKFTASTTQKLFQLKGSIPVIPNSVDADGFSPNHSSEIQATILYFGTLIRKKGVLDLMEIFNIISDKHPTAKLILAGSDSPDITTGKSTKALMENILSPAARLRVQFLGKLDYKNMQEQIAQATVITLPSYAEALPMTWIESMAMEKALVTSDIGWAKEVMIDGETGFTIHPADHTAYASKVMELLEDLELRRSMGAKARQQVKEKFSQQLVTQQNLEFYQKVIAAS